jgi:hypothetical protein
VFPRKNDALPDPTDASQGRRDEAVDVDHLLDDGPVDQGENQSGTNIVISTSVRGLQWKNLKFYSFKIITENSLIHKQN